MLIPRHFCKISLTKPLFVPAHAAASRPELPKCGQQQPAQQAFGIVQCKPKAQQLINDTVFGLWSHSQHRFPALLLGPTP